MIFPSSVQLRMVKLTAPTVNGVATMDLKIPDDNYVIAGGTGYFATGSHGDWVDIKLVDIDNVMGYGAGFVAGGFGDTLVPESNRGYYVNPNFELNIGSVVNNDPALLVKNLYLRVIATKADINDSDTFYVNLRWGKRLR